MMDLQRGSRILLVEDEELLRKVMAEELRDAGYIVEEASNGANAIVALGERFDVLLTDIRMAGRVNGWDLAEAARSIQSDIEVIYMTGYSGEIQKRVPNSEFIMKPCTVAQIVELMTTPGAGIAGQSLRR
jgi:CheY-like chemotaxis protein